MSSSNNKSSALNAADAVLRQYEGAADELADANGMFEPIAVVPTADAHLAAAAHRKVHDVVTAEIEPLQEK